MANWRRLDLTRKEGHPAPGELVALRIVPDSSNPTIARLHETYEIGRFSTDPRDPKSKKLWFFGRIGCQDPVRMRAAHKIWWARVPEFDG